MLAGVTTRWKQVIGYQFKGNSYEARQANEIISCLINGESIILKLVYLVDIGRVYRTFLNAPLS
jgi:hypothetical protein